MAGRPDTKAALNWDEMPPLLGASAEFHRPESMEYDGACRYDGRMHQSPFLQGLRNLANMAMTVHPFDRRPYEETEITVESRARPVDLGLAEGKSLVSVPSSIRVADDSPLVGGLTSVRDETEIVMDTLGDVEDETEAVAFYEARDIVSGKPAVLIKRLFTYKADGPSTIQWEKYAEAIQRLRESGALSEGELREHLNPVEPESSIPEQAEQ